MKRLCVLSVSLMAMLLAACAGGGSGVCAPGGDCAPRYPDARVLSNAAVEEFEDLGALPANLGLPDIHPDTVCEAAVSDAGLDDVQDAISDVMADKDWDNVLGWDYGGSIWQHKNSYAYIRSWDLDPEREVSIFRHDAPLEDLNIQPGEIQGAMALTVTCVFKQPAR